MKRPAPIRVGDTFEHDGTVWKVIVKMPGEELTLFSEERTAFLHCSQKTLRQWAWPRVDKNMASTETTI